MATPHIDCDKSQIAKTVLMPGDPMRSRFIAENFLTDAVLFNNVRGVQGYTGLWKGERVSVMASGMGIPSISLYSYELYNFFDVENIIRVGSAGAMVDELTLGDIVLAQGACTNSNYAKQFGLPGDFAPIATWKLLKAAVDMAEKTGLHTTVGNVISADTFYDPMPGVLDAWKRMGVLAVEMESAGLYVNAAHAGKNALAMFTISDHIYTGAKLTPKEREEGFSQMITLALDTAVSL